MALVLHIYMHYVSLGSSAVTVSTTECIQLLSVQTSTWQGSFAFYVLRVMKDFSICSMRQHPIKRIYCTVKW